MAVRGRVWLVRLTVPATNMCSSTSVSEAKRTWQKNVMSIPCVLFHLKNAAEERTLESRTLHVLSVLSHPLFTESQRTKTGRLEEIMRFYGLARKEQNKKENDTFDKAPELETRGVGCSGPEPVHMTEAKRRQTTEAKTLPQGLWEKKKEYGNQCEKSTGTR